MRILERVLIKLGIKKRVDFNSVEYQRSRGAKLVKMLYLLIAV